MLVLSFPAALLSVIEAELKRIQRDYERGRIPEWATDSWRTGEALVVVVQQEPAAQPAEPLQKSA